ncbi:DUF6212 domain-containing protein [Azospirillum picis]|uniref:Glycosyltransferase involved in cell wall biosynthesis n=1 Tax=Azospirillum picis TaxID=488438 RepID=A0ABU0MU75_9PROT|nr:DUF6212 domain-containing protein [Azospirillum picis]MBP2300898.1 glycosyltransferase involved in cell wall biosynthesis [Azospirillum picis]MDQ0537002.1 glycosyltransferase involved in cell wall biosynthesis [Azospirillum picis]
MTFPSVENGHIQIDFLNGDNTLLHLKFFPIDGKLIVNKHINGKWGIPERSFGAKLRKSSRNTVKIEHSEGASHIVLNGQWIGCLVDVVLEGKHCKCTANIDGLVLWSTSSANRNYWRFNCESSGATASAPVSQENAQLETGLSAIVRARNEGLNVYNCLSKVAPFVDEVIAIDNNSTDNTFNEMHRAQRENFNIRIHSYSIPVPRVGKDHRQALKQFSPNTLGRYYNFCLSKCRTTNFMKWDADFLPITKNLQDMISVMHLRQRTDCFTVWFSGISIWTDGKNFWVDRTNTYNEFRAHSKIHGAKWVDLPDWEEMDQTYLFSAHKLFYTVPVFAEIFHIDVDEFERRGVVRNDERDAHRADAIGYYKENGGLPKESFEECDLNEILSAKSQLTHSLVNRREKELKRYMGMRFDSAPQVHLHEIKSNKTIVNNFEEVEQATLAVLCITHRNNSSRMDVIRSSMKKEFDKLRVPFYFVVGTNKTSYIDGDVLYVTASDYYEGLSQKVSSAFKYIIENTSIRYALKIDDDCLVNAYQILQFPYWEHDYVGGGVSGGRNSTFDWHNGKCRNDQLHRQSVDVSKVGHWYGGGFSYFLSRKAMEVIVHKKTEVEKILYEDYAVALALREGGLGEDCQKMVTYPMASFQKAGKHMLASVVGVFDIPSDLDYGRIFSEFMHIRSFYAPEGMVKVNTDWFDWSTFPIGDEADVHQQTKNDGDEEDETIVLENQERDALESTERYGREYRLSLEHLSRAYEISPHRGDVGFDLVKLLEGSRVFVHPLEDHVTTVCVPGACAPGFQMVRVTVRTEHSRARPVEYGVAILPKGTSFPEFLESSSSVDSRFSGWISVGAEVDCTIEVNLGTPLDEAADVFVATRIPINGNSEFAWATCRNFDFFKS